MDLPGAFAKRLSCPCCKNPWNPSAEAPVEGAGNFACQPCLQDDKGFKGIDPANFDMNVSPAENFYTWANGGWKAKNEIPAGYSSWNSFIVLRDLNLERLKSILDDLSTGAPEDSSEEILKLQYFYKAYMDEEKIEALGAKAIEPIVSYALKGVQVNATETLANLHSKYGVNAFFKLYSSPDKMNSEQTIGSLYQSGLGMPDRDYYLDNNDKDKVDKRNKYVDYATVIFSLLGKHLDQFPKYKDQAACAKAAKEVLEFETALATLHLSRTLCRDPNLTYNKRSITILQNESRVNPSWAQYLTRGAEKIVAFDWQRYFSLVMNRDLGDVNVATYTALTQFPTLLAHPAVGTYLTFHIANSYAPHLSTDFVQAHFDFHEKAMKGTTELLPRWKRGLQILESSVGEILGRLYVAKYFPHTAKDQALTIVSTLKQALVKKIESITWMNEETKKEAYAKMSRLQTKIGYPNVWKNYTALQVTSTSSHVENIIASSSFEFAHECNYINRTTDRNRWFMTPQTINAYYHPSLNEIVFPAAILQFPFYDESCDVGILYGAFGAIVGHELTHGFDDQGRKYDSLGNLRDWWSTDDGAEYERRVDVMIKQAEQYEVHGLKLNGKLTCGENIADLGGVKLALAALKIYLQEHPEEKDVLINGLNITQRFFISWAQAWRENTKKERAMQLVTIDPHGPNEFRCNGTLSNVPDFHEAFEVKDGNAMFKPLDKCVDVW